VTYHEDPKSAMGIVATNFGKSTQNPVVILTSRFATRLSIN